MFGFINQTFIVLLRFGGALATKCISLHNEPLKVTPTSFDLNPNKIYQEIHHYPFIFSIDR